jgi:uroporphyrin-III C-methyltransferase/precorrin-2 dehydrogenase/sirohydrochlorin ferrochelatase
MDYFPLYARLSNTPCLIVGGGEVALRKARLLLRAGADLTVAAPEITHELQKLIEEHDINVINNEFTAELIGANQFIIAATANTSVNKQVAEAARTALRFCNVVDDRELSTAIVPALIDRSPLIIAVSTAGNSPVLATRIRQQIEQLLPPAMAELTAFTGHWRSAVQEKIATHDERRRFWQELLDGRLTSQVLDGDIDGATKSMQAALENNHPAGGEAWIVGAGPGDPELLTLKAARVLRSAEVIVHDRLVTPAVLEMARKDADFISVGKQAGTDSISQDEINRLLVRLVSEGKRVCRLKGGDPFIFGRGGEEIEALEAAGLPWQVIPGITAASGCAAAAGVPLTHRNTARSLVMVTPQTATDAEPDWEMLSRPAQTVVFYMALAKLPHICAQMVAAGRDSSCPAALIENGSTHQQRVIQGTLTTLPQLTADAGAGSPALLIVGEVAAMAKPTTANTDKQPATDLWSSTASTASTRDQ